MRKLKEKIVIQLMQLLPYLFSISRTMFFPFQDLGFPQICHSQPDLKFMFPNSYFLNPTSRFKNPTHSKVCIEKAIIFSFWWQHHLSLLNGDWGEVFFIPFLFYSLRIFIDGVWLWFSRKKENLSFLIMLTILVLHRNPGWSQCPSIVLVNLYFSFCCLGWILGCSVLNCLCLNS